MQNPADRIFLLNDRINQMLIEHLDPNVWKAKPPTSKPSGNAGTRTGRAATPANDCSAATGGAGAPAAGAATACRRPRSGQPSEGACARDGRAECREQRERCEQWRRLDGEAEAVVGPALLLP